jgi:hypothetical protein
MLEIQPPEIVLRQGGRSPGGAVSLLRPASPAGSPCALVPFGESCRLPFPPGAQAELLARNTRNAVFERWEGACGHSAGRSPRCILSSPGSGTVATRPLFHPPELAVTFAMPSMPSHLASAAGATMGSGRLDIRQGDAPARRCEGGRDAVCRQSFPTSATGLRLDPAPPSGQRFEPILLGIAFPAAPGARPCAADDGPWEAPQSTPLRCALHLNHRGDWLGGETSHQSAIARFGLPRLQVQRVASAGVTPGQSWLIGNDVTVATQQHSLLLRPAPASQREPAFVDFVGRDTQVEQRFADDRRGDATRNGVWALEGLEGKGCDVAQGRCVFTTSSEGRDAVRATYRPLANLVVSAAAGVQVSVTLANYPGDPCLRPGPSSPGVACRVISDLNRGVTVTVRRAAPNTAILIGCPQPPSLALDGTLTCSTTLPGAPGNEIQRIAQ